MRIIAARQIVYGPDNVDLVRNVRISKRKLAKLKKSSKLRAFCWEYNLFEPTGCNCSHCSRDYDCCGRMFVYTNQVERCKRGLRITNRYTRNI